ncbi:UDP-N-acetylglucosamine transferase subunit ALG13 [Balamuthia mandrillaris]
MAEEKKNKRRTVLVTVGSTQFEELIKAVDTLGFAEALIEQGFQRLLIQYGPKGQYEPHLLQGDSSLRGRLEVESFRMTAEFAAILASSDLVISHAGAGTIIEGLGLRKAMVVVVNENLMGNHQVEIAEVLAEERHLYQTTPAKLLATLAEADFGSLRPFPAPTTSRFASFLDRAMGFDD